MRKRKSKESSIIKNIPETWTISAKQTKISKSFEFKDFVSGFIFLARITIHAEVQKHHPDINLAYGRVKVSLTTHSQKALTAKDIKLAKVIDKLYTTG